MRCWCWSCWCWCWYWWLWCWVTKQNLKKSTWIAHRIDPRHNVPGENDPDDNGHSAWASVRRRGGRGEPGGSRVKEWQRWKMIIMITDHNNDHDDLAKLFSNAINETFLHFWTHSIFWAKKLSARSDIHLWRKIAQTLNEFCTEWCFGEMSDCPKVSLRSVQGGQWGLN